MGALVAVPLPNGLFAAIWILLREDDMTSFLVLDGHWTSLPTPDALRAAKPSPASSPPLPGVPDVWKGCFWGPLATDFVSVGTRAPAPNDLALMGFSGTMVFQDADQVRAELHRHGRLLHDRDALFAEYQRVEDELAQRAKNRRRGLSLSKMAQEKPFVRWSGRWPARAVREVPRISLAWAA